MEPSSLLLESKRKFDEGMRSLDSLEHLCLGLKDPGGTLVRQVHDVRAQLLLLRGQLDALISLRGAMASPTQEASEADEVIAQRVHRMAERIEEMRLQVETGRRG